MKKHLLTVLILALLAVITACNVNTNEQTSEITLPDIDGNPYTTHETIDGEEYISYDYSEVYDSLDLTQYTDWGSFGADGLMWVEKSNYTGKQFGYIDFKGNIVIPFTSEIISPGDFESGYAIVSYEYDGLSMGNGIHGVIDTKGEIKLKFKNHATSKHYQSKNGNIVFIGINMMDDLYSEPKNYIFCSNTKKTIEIPDGPVGTSGIYYSDGLLRTYRYEFFTDKNNYNDFKHIITFYNEDAEVTLVIDSKSSEYYMNLITVKDFICGKSEIIFVGQDRNYYKVTIDKTGKWIDEPTQIHKDEIGTDVF
jgi:hypothetical protein